MGPVKESFAAERPSDRKLVQLTQLRFCECRRQSGRDALEDFRSNISISEKYLRYFAADSKDFCAIEGQVNRLPNLFLSQAMYALGNGQGALDD